MVQKINSDHDAMIDTKLIEFRTDIAGDHATATEQADALAIAGWIFVAMFLYRPWGFIVMFKERTPLKKPSRPKKPGIRPRIGGTARIQ